MKLTVALAQIQVDKVWQKNAEKICQGIEQAAHKGAGLVIFPEGVTAADMNNPDLVSLAAQPLDGPMLQQILAKSAEFPEITAMMTVFVPHGDNWQSGDKVSNTLIAIRAGKIISKYNKLHLYDAFSMKESDHMIAGNEIPPLVDVNGVKVGMMICYDVRFPELARALTLAGADLLVLPAAWVRGPLKEMHWNVLVQARAIENTVYVAAVGEVGPRNIGMSQLVDPMGVALTNVGEIQGMQFAEIDTDRIAAVREKLPCLQNRRFAEMKLK